MKLERSTYQKPLSMTGFGGGATSLNFAGAGGGDHYFFSFYNTENAFQYPHAMDTTIDSSGNLYMCGGLATLGNSFVAKFDSKGVFQWGRKYEAHVIRFTGVKVDTSGNVYVAGYTGNAPSGSSYGNRFILFKYNSSGVIQWERELGDTNSSNNNECFCLEIDNSNNLYLGGWIESNSIGWSKSYLIAKYNSSGGLQNQQAVRFSNYIDTVHAIAYSSSIGGFWAVGLSYQISNLGYNTGYMNIARFNSSGTYYGTSKFLGHYNGIGNATYRDFDATMNGSDLYTCCSTSGNAIISKYNSSGTEQWCRFIYDGSTSLYPRGITTDSSGNVFVAGYIQDSSNFDVFIFKFNSSGVLQWQRKFTDQGGSYVDTVNGPCIQCDNLGNFYLVLTTATPSSGGSPRHMAVLKLPDDGSLTGTYSLTHSGSSAGSYTYSATSFTDDPRSNHPNLIESTTSHNAGTTNAGQTNSVFNLNNLYGGDTAYTPSGGFSDFTYLS
tara:strand:+ start:61 stop:1542 length:1482 start_codon:yes stop_codon:yes gene_type:complete